MRKKGKIVKLLTGFVMGSAIGSILGLTLAPKRGEKTREAIRDKSMEMFLRGKAKFKEEKKPSSFKKRLIEWLKPKKKRP